MTEPGFVRSESFCRRPSVRWRWIWKEEIVVVIVADIFVVIVVFAVIFVVVVVHGV